MLSQNDINFLINYINTTFHRPVQLFMKHLVTTLRYSFYNHKFRIEEHSNDLCVLSSYFGFQSTTLEIALNCLLTDKLLNEVVKTFRFIDKSTEYDNRCTVEDVITEALLSATSCREAVIPEIFARGIYNIIIKYLWYIEKEIRLGNGVDSSNTKFTAYPSKEVILHNATNMIDHPETPSAMKDNTTRLTIFISNYIEDCKREQSEIFIQLDFRWGSFYRSLDCLSQQLYYETSLQGNRVNFYVNSIYQDIINLAKTCVEPCFLPEAVELEYAGVNIKKPKPHMYIFHHPTA